MQFERGAGFTAPRFSGLRGGISVKVFRQRPNSVRPAIELGKARKPKPQPGRKSVGECWLPRLQELEEVKSLVTKGQQLGVLTFGDVATAVSEVELDESDVEDLYGHLEKAGIELVEDLDPAQKPPPPRTSASDGKAEVASARSRRST